MPDPMLDLLRAKLHTAYGTRMSRSLLFGSRARGEARPDSDYDVAVFLQDLANPRQEADRLADIEWEILRDTGAVVSAKAFAERDFETPTLILETIRSQGVPL